MKERYLTPEIKITYISKDIITYSETAEWEGPIIKAGKPDENTEFR